MNLFSVVRLSLLQVRLVRNILATPTPTPTPTLAAYANKNNFQRNQLRHTRHTPSREHVWRISRSNGFSMAQRPHSDVIIINFHVKKIIETRPDAVFHGAEKGLLFFEISPLSAYDRRQVGNFRIFFLEIVCVCH